MTLKLHNVPAMPTLAMLGDNGGVVTVNPEWCDWYELVFGVPAGEGYIKGREIMQQIDGTFSEFIGQRTEAMKSAIHLMMADDPNRPTAQFRTIEEARKSFTLIGKHAMDYDHKEEVFTFDGYFSVTDLEAILFIHRAEELIEKAKKHFGGFFGEAGAKTEQLDVNQLMQVMTPGRQVTDVDSEIFAQPVAASYAVSPMAEQFNSVVEAHATLAESGILRQNVIRTPGVNNLVLDGYFTPKDLEALLYLYRNNDPMVFPEKDANGLPKDKLQDFRSETVFPQAVGRPAYKLTDMHGDRGVICEVWPDDQKPLEGVAPEVEIIIDQDSIDRRLIPTGNAVLNRLITEGGGLRRGEWPGEVSARTARNNMVTQGGMTTHSFEQGDDDYPLLTELINKLDNFGVIFEGLNLDDMRLSVDAPWARGGSLVFKKDDGFHTLVVEKEDGTFKVASLKLADNGIVVVFEHNSKAVTYTGIAQMFEVFNNISPEKVKAAVAAIKAEHGQ